MNEQRLNEMMTELKHYINHQYRGGFDRGTQCSVVDDKTRIIIDFEFVKDD